MTLTLWNKRDPLGADMTRVRDEMARAFDRIFSEPFALVEAKGDRRGDFWAPAIDVSETESELIVRADVPGIAAKDLEISISGRDLVVAGTKAEEFEKKGENFYRSERRFGSFRRVIELPDTADLEKVAAESDNGVVTIHVAKKPNAKPKQVEVRQASKKVAVKE